MNTYILSQRLQWSQPVTFSGLTPFTNPDDFRILPNDWPYGVTTEIVHLVVWTKFPLPDEPHTGELEPATKVLVEDFVKKNFVQEGGMRREDVLWFRNWKGLKSVQAVEHFHVLLRDPSEEFVSRITGGVKAMQDLVIKEDGVTEEEGVLDEVAKVDSAAET